MLLVKGSLVIKITNTQPPFACSTLTTERCQVCPKPTIKTPERHPWRHSGVRHCQPRIHPTPRSSVTIPSPEHAIAS